jgi:hypothetical protein
VWQGCFALGKVLLKLGRESEAETQLKMAAGVVEAIAQNLTTPELAAQLSISRFSATR